MRNIIFIFFLLLFYACNRSGLSHLKIDDSEMTTITLSKNNKFTSLDIVDSMEIIPLNSGKELIGGIDGVFLTDSHIIVSDRFHAKSVFVFDRKGSLISTINRMGRSPQEYISLSHVALVPGKDQLAIYDNYGHKVLYFTFDGQFISSVPVIFNFSSMEFVNTDEIVCVTYGLGKSDQGLREYARNTDLIYLTDPDFKIKKSNFPLTYDDRKFQFVTPNLKKIGDRVYVNPVFCDTIYLAKSDGLKAWYHIDMKEIGGVANFANTITNDEFINLRKNKSTFSGRFTETNRHLLLSIVTPPNNHIDRYLYAKDSEEVYYIHKGNAKREHFITEMVESATTSYMNKFISVIQPYLIIQVMPEETRKEIPELANLTEDSNPVIVIYTLKDNF